MFFRLFRRNRKATRPAQTKLRRPFKPAGESLEDRCLLTAFPAVGQTGFLPPDPHGAAGTNSLIETVNARIALFTKTGTQIASADLDVTSGANGGFFRSVGTGLRSFDPWTIYDRYSARFIVLAPE